MIYNHLKKDDIKIEEGDNMTTLDEQLKELERHHNREIRRIVTKSLANHIESNFHEWVPEAKTNELMIKARIVEEIKKLPFRR